MSPLINIIILIVIGVAIIWILKKIFFNYKGVERTIQLDPKQQSSYDKKKDKPDELKTLTLEERIELSWDFLTKITDIIINKFTRAEQEQVHEAGKVLVQHGAQYQHNVQEEARTQKKFVKQTKRSKKKSTGGRGR